MATKYTKHFVLSASPNDHRMLICLLEALTKAFPEYYNRLSTAHLLADRYSSERFELRLAAEKREERPSGEVRAMIKAFRLGWNAHKAEMAEAEAKPDSLKNKYEALRAAIDRAAEGPGSVGAIKNFADSQDLSSFDAVSKALAQE